MWWNMASSRLLLALSSGISRICDVSAYCITVQQGNWMVQVFCFISEWFSRRVKYFMSETQPGRVICELNRREKSLYRKFEKSFVGLNTIVHPKHGRYERIDVVEHLNQMLEIGIPDTCLRLE
nr:hypothetical protein Iba_chr08eCG3860 [Ipomoea batatas]